MRREKKQPQQPTFQEDSRMRNTFRLPLASKKGMSAGKGKGKGKNGTLLQFVFVISSGILSSSVIATALKAWLDNRRTTLTIQFDGRRKTLTYKGHHLNQDAAIVQDIVEMLSDKTSLVTSIDAVTVDLTNDAQQGEALLVAGGHKDIVTHDEREYVIVRQRPSRLKPILPGWLLRPREAIAFSRQFGKQWRRFASRFEG